MKALYLLRCVFFAWIAEAVGISILTRVTSQTQQSSCESWVSFTPKKCLHIVDNAVFQTKAEARVVCQSLAEVMELDDVPRMVTVTSEAEQEALKKYLFEDIGLLEPVWLGLDREDDGIFRWNNGAEMHFNNLAEQNVSDADRPCVQMESGQGIYPMGQWVRVNCRKRNVVVCEKIQVWTTAKLQNSFFNLQSQVEVLTQRVQKLSGLDSGSAAKTLSFAKTQVVPSSLPKTPCGDWFPYKEEKCIKFVESAGFHTKDEAEGVCDAVGEQLQEKGGATLVTIKTKEKQQFLQNLLFEELSIPDTVWLGVDMGNGDDFQWNDGTDMVFNNWVGDSLDGAARERERNCVQMEAGEGVYEAGKWVRVSCKKKNAVVCERNQPLTVADLQNAVVNLKLEMQRNKQEFEQKLTDAKREAQDDVNSIKQEAHHKNNVAMQKINAANQEINSLKMNLVPVGFIYVQFPGRDPPATLWPQGTWKDISLEYAGLFFRVEGGEAAPFGALQEDNTRKLQILHVQTTKWAQGPLSIPEDGSWSADIFTGNAGPGTIYGIKLRSMPGEVRPRNKAVKIWQRIN